MFFIKHALSAIKSARIVINKPKTMIQCQFIGQPAGSETTITFAPQCLTKTDLMGELGHLLALPVYQLALLFTHEAWRQLEYTRALTGTTF
jgi:hypothetical protein